MSFTLAIPAHGPTLDAPSEIRLPHAPFLLLVDPESGAFQAHENPAATAQSHPGIVVAKFLNEREVKIVLGHHMGPHPAAALAKKGVQVFEGRPGTSVAALLELWRAGQLARLGEAEINARHGPHHHGHGGGGHHPHHHD